MRFVKVRLLERGRGYHNPLDAKEGNVDFKEHIAAICAIVKDGR